MILESDICPICLDPTERIYFGTACNHYFHSDCIQNWLKYSMKCPVCRKNLNQNVVYMYCKKENIDTGNKWTIGINNYGDTVCSYPFWLR